MHKFLVLMILGCALLARAQVIGVNPTPVGNYFWNASTSEFDMCPNSSTAEPFASTPQAFANYGFNGSLGQWTPATSCPGTGSGSGLTSFQGRTATAAVLLLSDVNPVLKTATNCNVAGGLVYSPFSNSCVSGSSFPAEPANQFLGGPTSGAAAVPTFRVLASGDFSAALAADSNFTLSSATINNTGTIFTQNLITSEDLAYHTDCSSAGNNSFAFGLISNGTFGGPLLATVATSGICPVQSDYTIGGWATDTLSVQNGGGLIFSNCGANASCPGSSPALSQQVLFTPTEPIGPCPNIPAPGPSNLPIWNFSADGHVAFCTNQTGSTWVNKI